MIQIARKMISKTKSFCVDKKYELLILFFVGFSLSQILHSPYISDDGIYYFLRGDAIYNNHGIITILVQNFQSWLQRGRFFPVSEYGLFIFYYVKSVYIYKLLIILSVCVNVSMFGILVENFTKSKKAKLTLMLTISLFFQIITTYHCALLSFQMFMQILFALLMLILIFLQKYYATMKRSYIVYSIVFFTISLMTYELAFAYFVIIVALIIFYNKEIKKILKVSFAYIVPALLVGALNIYIKITNTVQYDGISINLDPKTVIHTLIKQCIAAFPLSNYFFQKNNSILQNSIWGIIKNISVQDVLLTSVFLYLLYSIWKYVENGRIEINKIKFMLFAMCLYIMPAVLISISTKYQNELTLGYGYLPVYLQYFGLLLVFFGFVIFLRDILPSRLKQGRPRKLLLGIAMVIFAAVMLLNQQNSRLYIENSLSYWLYPKQAAQDAINLGILNDITKEDSITTISSYPWENSSFFTEFANRKITYFPYTESEAEKDDLYLFRYYGSKVDESAFLGKLDKKAQDSASQQVSTLEIFTNNMENTYVLYFTVDQSNNKVANIISLEDLQLVSAHGTSRIYRIESSQLIDFSTVAFLKNYTPPKASVYLEYGEGIYGAESNLNMTWRWCQQTAVIHIFNSNPTVVPIQFLANVSNLSEEESTLMITFGKEKFEQKYNYIESSIMLELSLQPGDNVLTLNTDASQIDTPLDSRQMYFRLTHVSVAGME